MTQPMHPPLVLSLLVLGLCGSALAQVPPSPDTGPPPKPALAAPPELRPPGDPGDMPDMPVPGETPASGADSVLRSTVRRADPLPSGVADLVSRFHPALVHLPIGLLLLTLFVDLMAFACRLPGWNRAGALLLAGTLLSLIPVLATGFLREAQLRDFYRLQLVELHTKMMLGCAAFGLLAFVQRVVRLRNRLSGANLAVYLVLMALALLLCVIGGHIGAKMVFGPTYLPF